MSDSGKKRRDGPRGNEGGPKRKKGHYMGSSQGRSTSEKAIPLGSTGLLVTCEAGREYKAYDEMMRLLEESFQRLGKDNVGRTSKQQHADTADTTPATDTQAAGGDVATAETAGATAAAAGATGAGSKAPSISDMLAAEVADLKKERVHRFRRHNTDVKGTLFVEFPKDPECPAAEAVALEIAQHTKSTRSLPSRFVMRLLPVSLTCFASKEELQGIVAVMVERYFGTDADSVKHPTEFAVEFEHRASDKLKRPEVIDIVAKAVPQPPYKVNLSTPARTILVQAVRNVVAISVVTSFKQLAKFNLRRLVEEEEEEEHKGAERQAAEGVAEAASPSACQKAGEADQQPSSAAKEAEAGAEAEAEQPPCTGVAAVEAAS